MCRRSMVRMDSVPGVSLGKASSSSDRGHLAVRGVTLLNAVDQGLIIDERSLRRTMTSIFLANGATLTITKDTALVFAALITGAVSLTAALTAGVFALRNEKSRQRHANELKTLELVEARIVERHAVLRETVAEFAATAIELAEQAEAVTRDPANSTAVDHLWAANGKLRIQYQILLLLSESVAVQDTARRLLRVAWNERQQALGKKRKHPRLLGSDAASVKEMRANLRPFVTAARSELGVGVTSPLT